MMKPEWKFNDNHEYASIETNRKIATITKLKDDRWRWVIYDKIKKPLAKRDGWWGIAKSATEAILEAEQKLNL